MYSKTVLVGNVGSDPEMKYTPSGLPVTTFSLAVNKKWKNGDGQQQEKTTWWRVSVWRQQAEIVSQYVTKGMKVLVEGEDIEARAFTDKQGNQRASLEITAHAVRFLSGKANSDPTDNVSVAGAEEIPF
mgnify:CR=1 FL=1